MVLLAVASLVVAVGCAVALVVVLARRSPPAPAVPEQPVTEELVAATVAALRAEQVATVQAAVESVVSVAGEQLGSRVEVADRALAQRQAAISTALEEDRNVVGRELAEARRQLTQMAELVGDLRRERAEQQGRLEQGLAEAVRSTTALTGTTDALRQALASTKARGQWGERMAEDVLRVAGFVEGINYRKQTAIAGGTIPDLTFPLPGGRELHMDVKFPFDNYLRALEADSDTERESYEAKFLSDVKARIREITTRSYIDAETTVDHVVLFIPNEAIFAFVHERDPGLVDHAIGQKVVICSPSTLFAVLAVVRQAVEQFRLERTSDEILACLASFEKEWTKYSESFAKLGSQMATAAKTYDALAGTRTNQLERTLAHIERLRTERGLEAVTPLSVAPATDGLTPSRAEGADEAPTSIDTRYLEAPTLDRAVGDDDRRAPTRPASLRLK
ncbi:DNA recombination protein RmuC [Rhabdothermincola salaria]|uniref:DNA recombination protein RmuC n=1 Tax=Rhabdothermincola salaria TaxID=2903142 RepID=UPI001E2F3481|nr:DNA recombination protein RmuC [Rhabdothermincola salaria]MCD9623501.1 DNA recombination protein RmuC [Rhabdothermincola salaria]